jgi:hypothetical protein
VLFLEAYARPLLVLHAISAAVLVGATTHHLLWSWRYRRGIYARLDGERTFALVSACAFVATFILGNLLYPTYKVRVRAEYLDNPPAVAEEARLRDTQRQAVTTSAASAAAVDLPPRRSLSSVARAFDIKEHWVALGCAASLLLLALSRLSHPQRHPQVLALYLGLSVAQCSAAWFGAVVGLWTASVRSVGGV